MFLNLEKLPQTFSYVIFNFAIVDNSEEHLIDCSQWWFRIQSFEYLVKPLRIFWQASTRHTKEPLFRPQSLPLMSKPWRSFWQTIKLSLLVTFLTWKVFQINKLHTKSQEMRLVHCRQSGILIGEIIRATISTASFEKRSRRLGCHDINHCLV